MAVIPVPQSTEARGWIRHGPRPGSSAAAVGAASPSSAARRTASGARGATATTASASAFRGLYPRHSYPWSREEGAAMKRRRAALERSAGEAEPPSSPDGAAGRELPNRAAWGETALDNCRRSLVWSSQNPAVLGGTRHRRLTCSIDLVHALTDKNGSFGERRRGLVSRRRSPKGLSPHK